MSHKINPDWFSPTREMFKPVDTGLYEFFSVVNDSSFPIPARAFDIKFKYNGKIYSNKNQRITFEDDVVTIGVPLTKNEDKEYYDYFAYHSYKNVIDKFGENYYSKNDIKLSMEQFLSSVQIMIKGLDKYNTFVDLLRIGDFVKFSTQRDKDSWRKIMKIDFDNNFIFGWKYLQPIDDEVYDTRNSSDNMISAIVDYRENENNPR